MKLNKAHEETLLIGKLNVQNQKIERLKSVLKNLNDENYLWSDLMPQRCVDNERFLLRIEREVLGTSFIQEESYQRFILDKAEEKDLKKFEAEK